MSKTAVFVIFGFVVAAVLYQVIERVPADALTVALGVACGVGASIPVMLGLLIALLRQRTPSPDMPEMSDPEPVPSRVPAPPRLAPLQAPHSQQPQIIVIAPPQGQYMPGQFAPGQLPQDLLRAMPWLTPQYPDESATGPTIDARDWRIIGEE
jgi:hypothetical protein